MARIDVDGSLIVFVPLICLMSITVVSIRKAIGFEVSQENVLVMGGLPKTSKRSKDVVTRKSKTKNNFPNYLKVKIISRCGVFS